MMEQDSKQMPEEATYNELPQSKKEKVLQAKLSQYFNEYSQKTNRSKQFVEKTLKENATKYLTFEDLALLTFRKELNLQLRYESINKQSINVLASWGKKTYVFRILILRESKVQKGQEVGHGNYGSIHFEQNNYFTFAIKYLPLNKTPRKSAIEEYFILKMCSDLGIGPKVKPFFGYQILMFQDCTAFAMEKCQKLTSTNYNRQQIFDAMAILHASHMVHQDIKPQNIMFSPFFNRLVFVDFGLSTFIEEEIGFKTSTSFVGTVLYCSQQMKKLIPKNDDEIKIGNVDLYYNDLVCLEGSIEAITKNIGEYEQQFDIFQGKIIKTTFFIEIYLRCCLDGNFFQKEFKTIWNFMLQTMKETSISSIYPETYLSNKMSQICSNLLQFVEELIITPDLVSLLSSIIPQIFKDTDRYKRIKTMSYISQIKICRRQMFIITEKYNYFNAICESLEVYWPNSQSVKTIVMDKLLGTLVPDLVYFYYYLEYISYFNNQYHVDAEIRCQAAKAYYRIFYEEEAPSDLEERDLVSLTIIHCLDRLLSSEQADSKNQIYRELLFKVYEFIAILDCGFSKEYMSWLDKIYNHWALKDYHKLFTKMVEVTNFWNLYRIKSKKYSNRIEFKEMIDQWVQKCNQQDFHNVLKFNDYIFRNRFTINIYYTLIKLDGIMVEGHSKPDIWQLRSMINLMNMVNYKCQHIGIMLYFPYLFPIKRYLRDMKNLGEDLISIWSNNIKDKIIQNQFCFTFLLENELAERPFDLNELIRINEYFKTISTQNIYLIQDVLLTIQFPQQSFWQHKLRNIRVGDKFTTEVLNKNIPKQSLLALEDPLFQKKFKGRYRINQEKKINNCITYSTDNYFISSEQVSFLYEQDSCINILLSSILYHFKLQVSKPIQKHKCYKIEEIMWISNFPSFVLNKRSEQIYQVITWSRLELLNKCNICSNYLIYFDKYNRFKVICSEIIKAIRANQQTVIEDNLIQSMKQNYEEILAYIGKIKQSNHLTSNLLRPTLSHMANLCLLDLDFQKIFSGLYNLYSMIIRSNDFTLFIDMNPLIWLMIAWLYQDQIPVLISKISLFLHFNLNFKIAQIFQTNFQIILNLNHNKNYKKVELFDTLSTYKEQDSCIILFYCKILRNVEGQANQKKILKAIIQKIDQVHFYFKRLISFDVFQFSLAFFKNKGRRYRVHYCNSLVKHAMVDNRTFPVERTFKTADKMTMKLFAKMRYFQAFEPMLTYQKYTFMRYKKSKL